MLCRLGDRLPRRGVLHHTGRHYMALLRATFLQHTLGFTVTHYVALVLSDCPVLDRAVANYSAKCEM